MLISGPCSCAGFPNGPRESCALEMVAGPRAPVCQKELHVKKIDSITTLSTYVRNRMATTTDNTSALCVSRSVHV